MNKENSGKLVMSFNRRDALTLSAAGMTTLMLPANASSEEQSINDCFPEPEINRRMRAIDGLSHKADYMRNALLFALDEYRAHETIIRGGDPDARPPVFTEDRSEALYRQVSTLRSAIALSYFRPGPDRLIREMSLCLGNGPYWLQKPPDDSLLALEEVI